MTYSVPCLGVAAEFPFWVFLAGVSAFGFVLAVVSFVVALAVFVLLRSGFRWLRLPSGDRASSLNQGSDVS